MPQYNKYPYTNMHNLNLDWILERLKIYTEKVDELESELADCSTNLANTYETIVNITNSRKLSPDGDFTGSLCNGAKTACEVVEQIDDNADTIDDVALKLEEKTSLEFIIDGGIYPFTGEANYEIDGGVM